MKSIIKYQKDLRKALELFGFTVTITHKEGFIEKVIRVDAYHKDFLDFDIHVEDPYYLFEQFDFNTDWDYVVERHVRSVVNFFITKLLEKANND